MFGALTVEFMGRKRGKAKTRINPRIIICCLKNIGEMDL
jgi:hypothetical protein